MKILLVIPDLSKGGASTAAAKLSTIFVQHGHEVYIIIFHDPIEYEYSGKLININVPLSTVMWNKLLIYVKRVVRLRKWIKSLKPDLIISFTESANTVTIIANRGFNYRHKVRIGGEPANLPSHYKPLFSLYKNAYKVVAVSNGIKEELEQKYHFTNIEVINNGIDMNYVDHKSSEPLTIHIPQPYILSIGRLVKMKSFDNLIYAFNKAFKGLPIHLVIGGEGEERIYLESIISQLQLKDKVHLIGKVDNPFPLFKNVMFYTLSSSSSEGFPNILVEALACGCPIIATDCRYGPREILEDGKYGILVPPDNIDALAENMKLLYENGELRKKLQIKSVQRAHYYNINNIVQQWLK